MRIKRAILFYGLLILLSVTGSTRATAVIDFEDWVGGDGNYTSAISQGYQLESTGEQIFSIFKSGSANNKTKALHTRMAFPPGSLSLSSSNNASFDLLSFDAQESSPPLASTIITITGTFQAGGTISQVFTFDGLSSSFETFHPVGFTDLQNVTFGANGSGLFALDNFVVPEPNIVFPVITLLIFNRQRKEETKEETKGN